jgi:hypothetical protein
MTRTVVILLFVAGGAGMILAAILVYWIVIHR